MHTGMCLGIVSRTVCIVIAAAVIWLIAYIVYGRTVVMAYIVMAYIVMAYIVHGIYSYARMPSYGLESHGLYSYGLHSHDAMYIYGAT